MGHAVHPDHNAGDHGEFVAVQQAYENLIKNRGQAQAPRGEDSWNFHDWWVRCSPVRHVPYLFRNLPVSVHDVARLYTVCGWVIYISKRW